MASVTEDSSCYLVNDPSGLTNDKMSRLLEESPRCLVPLKSYLNLKIFADKMTASAQTLDVLLCTSVERNQSLHESFKCLEDRFRCLVELRDDTLYVSLRELEEGISKTLRLLEHIREDFDGHKMSEDNFSEALTLITATLEDVEPETFISRLFDGMKVDDL